MQRTVSSAPSWSVPHGGQRFLATRRQRIAMRHQALDRTPSAGLHAMAVVLEICPAGLVQHVGSLTR